MRNNPTSAPDKDTWISQACVVKIKDVETFEKALDYEKVFTDATTDCEDAAILALNDKKRRGNKKMDVADHNKKLSQYQLLDVTSAPAQLPNRLLQGNQFQYASTSHDYQMNMHFQPDGSNFENIQQLSNITLTTGTEPMRTDTLESEIMPDDSSQNDQIMVEVGTNPIRELQNKISALNNTFDAFLTQYASDMVDIKLKLCVFARNDQTLPCITTRFNAASFFTKFPIDSVEKMKIFNCQIGKGYELKNEDKSYL